jgi:hypothetical protein
VPESPTFDQCVERLHGEFRAYDAAVDLVSCWEFFFTQVKPLSTNVLQFDRFPRLSSSEEGETEKTPDFGVLVSPSYGLIGEIKAGFPIEQRSFLGHLGKLKKYDRPLDFKAGPKGERLVPTTHDILLLIPLRDAQEIVTRLEEILRGGLIQFERSLVIFEWYYDHDRNEFVFRKVAGQSSDFRDTSVGEDVRLSTYFSRRAASLKVTPDKIQDIKATWQFCNDPPPTIFTLVFLWTKVFYHLLTQAQREEWRRRNAQKQMPLDVTVSQLAGEIEGRYPLRWGHWSEWCRDALEALTLSGLARKLEKNRYIVGYRNIAKELGEPGHLAGSPSHLSDFARSLATYLCRGRLGIGKEVPPEPGAPTQPTLFTE